MDKIFADKDGNGKVKVSMLLSPSGNDSDKENWSPDEEGNPQHRHQLPLTAGGRCLLLPQIRGGVSCTSTAALFSARTRLL